MPSSRRRTFYLHTLDGRPASIQRSTTTGAVWLALIAGRNKLQLATSLSQIRQEWNECCETEAAERPSNPNAAREYLARCGYVRVTLPVEMVAPEPPTLKERQALELIASTNRARGVSPTFKEIAAGLGVRSLSTVSDLVSRLERKGWIAHGGRANRSIELLHPVPACAPPT